MRRYVLEAEMKIQPKGSVLIGTLTVICGYMLVRGCVYYFLPVTSVETWFLRDALMNIPRLGAFMALVLLNRTWNALRLELPVSDLGRAALLGFAPVALWTFYFSGGSGPPFTRLMMLVGIFSSLIVGVWEEYAFRGALLFAFRQRMPVFASIVLSSGVFAIYHVEAQPFRAWLHIILMGVIFANLRFRGLSLGWLAMIHGVIDALFFFFPAFNPDPFGFRGLMFQAGLLIYAVATWPRSINT
jgi:membrane protease YdiL (CAAX protease family)